MFEETQIWYLLYSLASAKKNMKPISYKVGDIRPDNIFINDYGHVKVANLHSWPEAKTNFTKYFNG